MTDNKSKPTTSDEKVGACITATLVLCVPACALIFFSTTITGYFSHQMSIWLAAPLGWLLGAFIVIIGILMAGGHEGMFGYDMGGIVLGPLYLLIMFFVLRPVFENAASKAAANRAKQQPNSTLHINPSK